SIGITSIGIRARSDCAEITIHAVLRNTGGVHLVARSFFTELLCDTLENAPKLLRNWHEHTVRLLEKVIDQAESGKIKPRTAKALADYLRAWRDLLVKYKDRIEENKMIH
ncbi:MAG: hypothetical protein QXU65_06685, partial [Sulfolobales archaeon]